MRGTEYPNDMKALIALGHRRPDFEKWMDGLDTEHKRVGLPYGDGSIWDITGPACWIMYFEDDWTPADALAEDLSYA